MNNDDNRSSAAGEAFESGYLRSLLEEYRDESDVFLARTTLTLAERNEYYRETFDWETAPALPLIEWETPRWKPRSAAELSDAQVSVELLNVATRLHRLNQLICRADHLSDRRLYNLIVKRVLPCWVKRLKRPRSFCCWDFCGYAEDARLSATAVDLEELNALAFYATDEERYDWASETGRKLPPKTPIRRRDYFPFNVRVDF